MTDPPNEAAPVVSSRLTALSLSSPRLRRQLLPQGLVSSPYRVLDYHQTLLLKDPKGARAVFRREQRIQFQQPGVEASLDHYWGAGVGLVAYHTTAGPLGDSFRDAGRRHLLIRLTRPMDRGETLDLVIERTAMETFLEDEEWEETTVDHPILRLRRTILFPKNRPCRSAKLIYQGRAFPLHVLETADGRTQLSVRIGQPRADTPYTIRWSW